MIVPSYLFTLIRDACSLEFRLDMPIDMFIRVLVRAVTATSPFLSIINVSPERSIWSSGSHGCVRQAVPSAHMTTVPLESPFIRRIEASDNAAFSTSSADALISPEKDSPDLMLNFFCRILLVYRLIQIKNRFRIALLFS